MSETGTLAGDVPQAAAWPRAVAAALALAVLAVPIAGCGLSKKVHRFKASCVIAVDGSGSSDDRHGFDATRHIEVATPTFIANQQCGKVTFVPIDGTSTVSVCSAPEVVVDPDSLPAGQSRHQVRVRAVARARANAKQVLDCVRHDPRSVKGSDVVGALTRAAQFRPDKGLFSVLVVSDWINNNNGIDLAKEDLSSAAARTRAMNRLVEIPDLSGMHIFESGFGGPFPGGAAGAANFRAFWREFLLTRAKAASFDTKGYGVDIDTTTAPKA